MLDQTGIPGVLVPRKAFRDSGMAEHLVLPVGLPGYGRLKGVDRLLGLMRP